MNWIPFSVSAKALVRPSPWLVAALPLALLSISPVAALNTCTIKGNPAILGENWSATVDVVSGAGCIYGMSLQGSVTNTEIVQPAQHGTVKLVDMTTWTYEPSPGYRGGDAFSLRITGQSLQEKPGTSLIHLSVNVQY